MIHTTTAYNNAITSKNRQIDATVELYYGSTKRYTFTKNDILKSFTIDRIGDMSKFFGFTVIQRFNIHLIDFGRTIDNITTDCYFKVFLTVGGQAIGFPNFYVTEVNRDEKTGELSITSYDKLYFTSQYKIGDYAPEPPYSPRDLMKAISDKMGMSCDFLASDEDLAQTVFDNLYPQGINIEGTESVRDILDALAEATGSIIFIDYRNLLVLKRYSENVQVALLKDIYFDLSCKTNRKLTGLCHATTLGNNVLANNNSSGSTQYLRDNPFLDARNDDLEAIVGNLFSLVSNLTINQFSATWRGNPALEIGDRIALISAKENDIFYSYLLNDTLEYNGGLRQTTDWQYEDNETETPANPNNLGELAKQTYAITDKVNKQIELLVSEVKQNSSMISSIELTTDGISANVERVENIANSNTSEIAELTKRVNATMTEEEINIAISSKIKEGVDSVETSTGFTFDENGLHISKSDTDISTTITENGMTVSKGSTAVLVANDAGVEARDLHANTYLTIGKNSRFEDYNSNRTGCFWIGN